MSPSAMLDCHNSSRRVSSLTWETRLLNSAEAGTARKTTGLLARRLPLHEERELASQLTRLEVQAVLQRLTQVLAAGREVAGNEREVEREQHRARSRKSAPYHSVRQQPDRWPLGDAEEPAHHGMR